MYIFYIEYIKSMCKERDDYIDFIVLDQWEFDK